MQGRETIKVWVRQEDASEEGAVKVRLDVDADVSDLLQACASLFVFGPSQKRLVPTQLRMLDGKGIPLSNRFRVREVYEEDSTLVIQQRPTQRGPALQYSPPGRVTAGCGPRGRSPSPVTSVRRGRSGSGSRAGNAPNYLRSTSSSSKRAAHAPSVAPDPCIVGPALGFGSSRPRFRSSSRTRDGSGRPLETEPGFVERLYRPKKPQQQPQLQLQQQQPIPPKRGRRRLPVEWRKGDGSGRSSSNSTAGTTPQAPSLSPQGGRGPQSCQGKKPMGKDAVRDLDTLLKSAAAERAKAEESETQGAGGSAVTQQALPTASDFYDTLLQKRSSVEKLEALTRRSSGSLGALKQNEDRDSSSQEEDESTWLLTQSPRASEERHVDPSQQLKRLNAEGGEQGAEESSLSQSGDGNTSQRKELSEQSEQDASALALRRIEAAAEAAEVAEIAACQESVALRVTESATSVFDVSTASGPTNSPMVEADAAETSHNSMRLPAVDPATRQTPPERKLSEASTASSSSATTSSTESSSCLTPDIPLLSGPPASPSPDRSSTSVPPTPATPMPDWGDPSYQGAEFASEY